MVVDVHYDGDPHGVSLERAGGIQLLWDRNWTLDRRFVVALVLL